MLFPLTIFVLLFNSVASRMVNPFVEVDEITRRASVRLSNGCSGTLVSSNLVYTAAHCLHGIHVSSLLVYHPSQPQRYHRVQNMFYPGDFGIGWDFVKNMEANRRMCNTEDCNQQCVQHRQTMQQYYERLDYGLVLLAEHVELCVYPSGPVAATLRYPVLSQQGKTYVPAQEKMECFVAGYGITDYDGFRDINLGIVDRLFGMDTVSRCRKPHLKQFFIRFHNSKPDNPRPTNTCPGDSGAGVQCISRGGTDLSVIGIATKGTGGVRGNDRETCLAPHQSIALATSDHSWELYNKIKEWNAMTNYDAVYHKCQAFLKQHPYQSVMQRYFGRNPEFY